jgi:hypothetical protein
MSTIEQRIQISGILIALGLVILFVSLIPNHPLAFVGFAVLGVPLLFAGIAWYLISLLRQSPNGK